MQKRHVIFLDSTNTTHKTHNKWTHTLSAQYAPRVPRRTDVSASGTPSPSVLLSLMHSLIALALMPLSLTTSSSGKSVFPPGFLLLLLLLLLLLFFIFFFFFFVLCSLLFYLFFLCPSHTHLLIHHLTLNPPAASHKRVVRQATLVVTWSLRPSTFQSPFQELPLIASVAPPSKPFTLQHKQSCQVSKMLLLPQVSST